MDIKISKKSILEAIWSSSNDSNSVKKLAIGKEGDRYTTKSLSDELDVGITEPIHSNEENDGIEIVVWWMELWLMIATPLPPDNWGLL